MSWAGRRRALILFVIGAVVVAFLAILLISTFSKAPSCTDNVQNQGEAGVDCGGPCAYLCQAQAAAPVVRFTQAIAPATGRTDVIAYVDNPNATAAAKNVPYHLALYGADHTLVAKGDGVVDLPPSARVPIYIPNIFSGSRTVAESFITFDPATIAWYAATDTRIIPHVESPVVGGTPESPRITAALENPSTTTLYNVKVIAVVFDASGNVIGASQTVIASLGSAARTVATFTWNSAFVAPVARVEVLPIVPLPAGKQGL